MSIGKLKCLLYHELMKKAVQGLTQNETAIIYYLSMDEEIQIIIEDKKKCRKKV